MEKLKEKILKYKKSLLISSIFLIGILSRILLIASYPNALNIDEASSGYDAWSLLNFGIDRNGKSWPVYLIAWGSGQSVLYSILLIPFIKILGLNIFSMRFVMAIVGCISLVIMYLLLKEMKNEKIALIGLAFFAICPWHIMKSRWGMEANLFPDLILWAVYFLVRYLNQRQKRWLIISAIILGLSSYSYGTSYFFLPLFLIPVLIKLIKSKKMTILNSGIMLGIVGIIALPIIIFIFINTFNFNEVKIFSITIPRLVVNRYEEMVTIFNGGFFVGIYSNFITLIKLIIFQEDGLIWNSIGAFGIIYLTSLPFFIIGIILEFRNKERKYSFLLNTWFIVSVLMTLTLSEVNINRCNILMIPLAYYSIIGIAYVIEKLPNIKEIIFFAYVVQFILFGITYFNINFDRYYTFSNGIQEVLEYVEDEDDVEKIFFPYTIKEPFIHVLFYTQPDVHEYVETVVKKYSTGTFENILAFGKYNFYNTEDINIEENSQNIYIIDKTENIDGFEIDENWKTTEFEKYLVVRYNN